jgi:steroid Delta-isomerase
MPSVEDIQRTYQQYAAAWSRNDIDAVTGLFAPDAVVHDPVDGPALKGIDAIRDFFNGSVSVVRSMTVAGPVHISGDCRHAAASVDVEVDLGSRVQVVEALDVWTFDDEGRIATMNAYYGPTNLRDA